MLRKYCLSTTKDWDEGVPLLFATREIVQESLRFSHAELVFAHQVRGPSKVLIERMLFVNSSSKTNILDYVSKFHERLHSACTLAKDALTTAQKGMKHKYDKKAFARSFTMGDKVLILLPVSGSSLSARFLGPYVIQKKISEMYYIILTTDQKCKTRVCHINMLKANHAKETLGKDSFLSNAEPVVPIITVTQSSSEENLDADDVVLHHTQQCVRLKNSEILGDLNSYLKHLFCDQKEDITALISEFNGLFCDVPTQTNVLKNDIDVGKAHPIKQHAYR